MRSILYTTILTTFIASSAIAADTTTAAPAAVPAVKQEAPKIDLASTTLNDKMTGDYELDKDHASLIFTISHLGYSHYTGRFNTLESQIHFDAKDIAKSTLKATVTMGSVDTHNSTLEAELITKNWFNIQAFPAATFTSTKVEKTGETTGKITGDLTFMGVTKPVTLDVVFNGGGNDPYHKKDKLGFSAKTVLKRSDFGMNAYIPMVGDNVALDIEAEFFKKD